MNNLNININDIFNEMILENKTSDLLGLKKSKLKLLENEFFNASIQKYESLELAIDTATKCQEKWEAETPFSRSMKLHKVSRHLTKHSNRYLKNQLFDESEYSLIVNIFDTYSDFALLIEELPNWKPIGTVYLKLNGNTPLYFITATVVAAIAAGCSVIVHTPEEESWFPSFLASVFKFEGFPPELIILLSKSEQNLSALEKVHKIIFYGSYLEAQNQYINCVARSFSFLCPNNTSSIILESCDISAAVNKIFTETWATNSSNMWGVSTVVVQESIIHQFLEKLRTCMDQYRNLMFPSSIHKNEVVLEKINKLITEASSKGAEVIKLSQNDKEWGPTVFIDYQNQNIDLDVPILKVLLCRTPAEGVILLNNSRFSLGTSIWCENSSQALEVATKLNCKNIWLNCHGVVEAGVSFQSFGCSGNYSFNGMAGILEFITFKSTNSPVGKYTIKETESLQKINVWSTISAAQSAFTKWRFDKNKRKYLIDIASLVEEEKNYSNLAEIFKYYGILANNSGYFGNQNSQQFNIVYKNEAVGVIAVVVNSLSADLSKIISFIAPAIAFGNTVILVMQENNSKSQFFIDFLKNNLPSNVLNVVIGLQAVAELASSSVVQALWFFDEYLSSEYLQKIRNLAAHNLKCIWMIPKDASKSLQIIRKECVKSKTIWLTNIDQFPK